MVDLPWLQQQPSALASMGSNVIQPQGSDFASSLMRLAAATSGPNAYQEYTSGRAGAGNTPSAIQEYQYYMNLPEDQRAEYLRVKRAEQWLNAGGQFVNPNAGTAIPKTPQPQDMPVFQAEQEKAKKDAVLLAEKESLYPNAAARIDANTKIIDEALNHKGFDANFGKAGYLPNIPGGAPADARTYIDQIKGTAFLTAIGELKGSGSISEKEGDAATSAVARLQTAQSAESARKALGDLKDILSDAKKRAGAGTKYIENSASPNTESTERTIVKTQISPSTGKRKIIYSDGTEEIQ